jgi:AcrR family transcriptional regulator
MPRPVDSQRHEALLDAAAAHVRSHGVSELSFRTLANALGITANTLVHHFGSKQPLTVAVMNRVRDQLLATTMEDGPSVPIDGTTWRAWGWAASEEHEQLFRSFFEMYGLALMHPERYGPFLDRVVDDWLEAIAIRLRDRGLPGEEATVRATLGLAVVRGLLLDYLTTGDRNRAEAALRLFTAGQFPPHAL